MKSFGLTGNSLDNSSDCHPAPHEDIYVPYVSQKKGTDHERY